MVGDVEGPGSQKTVDNTEGDTCKVVVKSVEDGWIPRFEQLLISSMSE